MLMPGLLDAFAEHRITTPAGSEHGQREHDSLLDPEEVPEEPAEEEEVAQTLSTPEGLISPVCGHCLPATRHAPTLKPAM
jgi:hypothetical protein